MVMVLFPQDAVTPAGKFVAVPIPVAAMVVCVILVNKVFMHTVGLLDAILAPLTVINPVAFTLPHPPVKGIE